MSKSYVAIALAFALLSPAAMAQSASTTPAARATASVTISAADQTKLKDWITMQKTASVAAPAGVTVAVGSTLPTSIMLHPIATTVGVASVGTNEYTVIDNKVVLVSRTDHKIVYVFS
jgi:hypothetical protein